MRLRGTGCAVSALVLGSLVSGCGAAKVTAAGPTGSRTVLQANDAADGSLRWQIDLGRTGATTPVLVGDSVVVAAPGGGATAYALEDGAARWSVPEAGAPHAVAGDLAVFDLGDRLEARRAADGEVAWTRATGGDLIQARAGGPLALVAQAAAKKPLVETAARPGPSWLSLLDPATGADRWSARLPGRVDIDSSAVSARHVLATYATDYSGRTTVAALRLADGKREWSYPAGPVNSVSAAGEIPAVTVGVDRARAEALDPRTGKRLWAVTEDDMIDARLAPFLGQDGTVAFRRDPRTGKRLPGTVPAAYGVGVHGDLLVGADGRTLTALRGADEAWTAEVPRGAAPVTYLDVDERVVVSVTAVGQKDDRS